MKKKKTLSRIALLAEDRRLTETGEEAVKEAGRLKQKLAGRRQANERAVILDAIAAQGETVTLRFSTQGITGKIERTPDGYFWLDPRGRGGQLPGGSIQKRVHVARVIAKAIPEDDIQTIEGEGGQVLWRK